MSKDNFYYVVAEPQHRGDFRPVVLDYGIDLITADKVVHRFINENGLRIKIGNKKFPTFVRIHRISDTLPDDYLLITAVEVIE